MISLVEDFAANAAAVGFHVHRGEAPTIEGAGVSPAIYGLADTGSVVLAAAPEEPRARSLLPFIHVTLLREDLILPGLSELFAALGRLGQPLGGAAGPGREWARGRRLPRLAGRRYRDTR